MKATLIISGKVQGVGFRNFVRVNAKYTNLVGVVHNLSDGRVEAFVEGEQGDIDKLVEKIKIAQQFGRAFVDKVEVYPEGADGYNGPWKDYNGRFIIDERVV
ncbi:MAG: acylphosphatase [Candidatus Micrarchaeota archaeon]|nr:acylphosphatase [Candidatus Micrarchaeota archaeon]